ncbi:MAG: dephospho-CoA kinase [Verrucomicrobia bacterium]|nr:dephospho-CoA kinase [Verrucomicrobiota bacterium]
MKLIGITGGIGMGKSASANFLQAQGYPITDTDNLAREVVEPGEVALDHIVRVFGPGLLDSHGRLCRDKLAAIVFADPARRKELESILHPLIRTRWLQESAEWRRLGRSVGFVVIPLLYETKAESEFDAVVCVACTAATQQERLASRGWSVEEQQNRRDAQWAIERKMAGAQYVIWTEGDIPSLHRQWEITCANLGGRGRS